VTGASSGIGAAFCRLLAREGFDLVITARRADRLQELKAQLQPATQVHLVPLDLGLAESPRQLFTTTQQLGLTVDLLVNNAGYALPGHYLQSSWEDQARLIQVLATTPAHLVHLYLPDMVRRHRGYVLNVASLGALVPASPHLTLYAALKHFVLVMNRSLREVREQRHPVHRVVPGTYRHRWAGAAQLDSVFAQMPRWLVLSPDRVATRRLPRDGRPSCRPAGCGARHRSAAPFFPDALALKWLAKNERGAGRVKVSRGPHPAPDDPAVIADRLHARSAHTGRGTQSRHEVRPGMKLFACLNLTDQELDTYNRYYNHFREQVPDAVMETRSEHHRPFVVAMDVHRAWILEDAWVAVRGREHEKDQIAFLHLLAVPFKVLGRDARLRRRHGGVAHQLEAHSRVFSG
jgi:short-subunit dehydrogenase